MRHYSHRVSEEGRRPRGRYIEAARNDVALLDAAREVFTSHGYDAPVSAVAARAGVGVGSVYRRYGTKEELLQALCVLSMEQAAEAAEAGLADADPWSGLERYVRLCVARRTGVLGPLAGRITTTPRMHEAHRRQQRLLGRLIRRAHRAGVLRDDVNAIEVSVLISWLGRQGDGSIDGNARERAVRDRMVTIMLEGLRTRSDPTPLPGRPPSRRWYEEPWSTPTE